jgi:hypothetical protein
VVLSKGAGLTGEGRVISHAHLLVVSLTRYVSHDFLRRRKERPLEGTRDQPS